MADAESRRRVWQFRVAMDGAADEARRGGRLDACRGAAPAAEHARPVCGRCGAACGSAHGACVSEMHMCAA